MDLVSGKVLVGAACEGAENRAALRSAAQPAGVKKLGYFRRTVWHRVDYDSPQWVRDLGQTMS